MDVAEVDVETEPGGPVVVTMALAPAPADRTEPDSVALSRIGLTADWSFELV
jgi:hypothetical protein